MFTVLFKPNIGLSISLNSTFYPIDDDFQVEVEFSDPEAKKLQREGEWPTFGYAGACRVICNGHIFGNTNADFWARRQAFLDALTPQDKELTIRTHGRLTITDTDAAEGMYQNCRIINRVANLDNLSPMRCPYTVTFKAFTPHFIGVATGKAYVLG